MIDAAVQTSSVAAYENVMDAIKERAPGHLSFDDRMERLAKLIDLLPEKGRNLLQNHINNFLKVMADKEASDIDCGGYGCNEQVWLRVFGVKKPCFELGHHTVDEMDILILSLLSKDGRAKLFKHRSFDFSHSIQYKGNQVRFRATAYFDLDHIGMNMRLINTLLRPLKSLQFHENVEKQMSLKHVKRGLVLITGITGSGKSTTLDSIIDANNQEADAHIVIISNPVEFVHHSKKCIVRHREVGKDVASFKDGTVQALRQDPDIIVIGEMRDPETISVALEVADSGHKVFSTLHTSSATEAIDRILGEMPPTEQNRIRERLADVITCIVSQKLVPTVDGRRVMVKEVLLAATSIRSAIRNNHTEEIYQLIYQGSSIGMTTMEQDLVRLFKSHIITYEEALNNANNKKRFEELVKITQMQEK